MIIIWWYIWRNTSDCYAWI